MMTARPPSSTPSQHLSSPDSSAAPSATERRHSSTAASQAFANNPYEQANMVIEDSTASHGPRPGHSPLNPDNFVPLHEANPDDSAEITSLFTTFDSAAVRGLHVHAPHGASGMDGSFGRLQPPRASLSRSQQLGNSTTHSPYVPVTEEGLRARQLQQHQLQQQQQQMQQQQQQIMHQSQELLYGGYGGGVSSYSRFNNSTSQADMNPLAFNFDHSDAAMRTPLSSGNSSSDVAMLVDVYESDTITVSVKQRTSQRANSRSSSLNGSSTAIQQMAEAAEKAGTVYVPGRSPSASFHAALAGHQHFVPSATSLQLASNTPTHADAHGMVRAPLLYPQGGPVVAAAGGGYQPVNAQGQAFGQMPVPLHVDPRAVNAAGAPGHAAQFAMPSCAPVPQSGSSSSPPEAQPAAATRNGVLQATNAAPRGGRAGRGRGAGRGDGAAKLPQPLSTATGDAGNDKSASKSGSQENASTTSPSGNSRRSSAPKGPIAPHADRALPVRGFVVVKGKHDGHRYATTQSRESLPPMGSQVIVEGDRGEDMGILTGFITVPDMIANCIELHRLKQNDERRRGAKGASNNNNSNENKGSDDDNADGDGKESAATAVNVDGVTVASDEAGQQEQIRSIIFTCKSWPYYLRPAEQAELDQIPQLREDEAEAFEAARAVVHHFVSIAFQQQQHRQSRPTKEDGEDADTAAKASGAPTGDDVHRPAPADPAEVKLVDCEYQLDRKKLTLFVVRPSREVFVDFRRMQRKLFRAFHCRIWFVYMDEISADSDAAEAVAHQLQRPSAESNTGAEKEKP